MAEGKDSPFPGSKISANVHGGKPGSLRSPLSRGGATKGDAAGWFNGSALITCYIESFLCFHCRKRLPLFITQPGLHAETQRREGAKGPLRSRMYFTRRHRGTELRFAALTDTVHARRNEGRRGGISSRAFPSADRQLSSTTNRWLPDWIDAHPMHKRNESTPMIHAFKETAVSRRRRVNSERSEQKRASPEGGSSKRFKDTCQNSFLGALMALPTCALLTFSFPRLSKIQLVILLQIW